MAVKRISKVLEIEWQRLVKGGGTCPRCGLTEKELDKAVSYLKETLKDKNITVALKKKRLSVAEFEKAPLQSNRILINGRTLEEWLGAKTGKSKCCSSCGDSECRTLDTDKGRYEMIPSNLIIKAGLIASRTLIAKK